MTRLAILTDIHGNAPALHAVMADMAQFSPDHVIIGGDFINGALFDLEVIDILFKQNTWTSIRGNHEFYLMDQLTDNPRFSNALYDNLKATLVDWYALIASLPDSLTLYYPDGPPVRVVHGVPGDNQDAINYLTTDGEVRRKLADVTSPVFVAGHYHIPVERRVDDWLILNPGSLGMIADGTHDAAYLLLETSDGEWQPTFRRVPYDFAPVTARYESLADKIGPVGWLTHLQVKHARPLTNAYFSWRYQHHPGADDTYDLMQHFLAKVDPWAYFPPAYQVNRDLMPDKFT